MPFTLSSLNFSRPREPSTSSLNYPEHPLQNRDRPVYVDYIDIELDNRDMIESPRQIATPPPAYVPGDRSASRRQRIASRISTFDFRSHALREKAGHLDLLRLLRTYGLRDLEKADWKRLNELRERAEMEAYLRLLKLGWDFSGYYGVLFSSLKAVAQISGTERGDHFLRKTEDGWRENMGLCRHTEQMRQIRRKMAEDGSFVGLGQNMAHVKTADELTDDLFGRFSLNLDEVLVREEVRRTVKARRDRRRWTQGKWFKILLSLVFVAFLLSIAAMFIRAGVMCLDGNCAGAMGLKATPMPKGGQGMGGNNGPPPDQSGESQPGQSVGDELFDIFQ